jgi:ribosomal protein S27AE
MRIWMHLILSSVAVFAGFFAGGLVLAGLLELIRVWPQWILIPTIIVSAFVLVFGGLRLGEWLVRRLSARCPQCRGRAYAEGHRPIRFRCTACGHVHYTNMRTNWGAD